jgi:hypothetical protein
MKSMRDIGILSVLLVAVCMTVSLPLGHAVSGVHPSGPQQILITDRHMILLGSKTQFVTLEVRATIHGSTYPNIALILNVYYDAILNLNADPNRYKGTPFYGPVSVTVKLTADPNNSDMRVGSAAFTVTLTASGHYLYLVQGYSPSGTRLGSDWFDPRCGGTAGTM